MKSLITFLFLVCLVLCSAQELHTTDKDLPCLDKHYNLVVHAIYDSLRTTHTMEALDGAISTANKYFAPICVSFSRCFSDTVYNYNYNKLLPRNELSEVATLYNDDNRINLYLLTDTLLEDWIGGLCAGSVGGVTNADIYLRALGALTHELGHFFGLSHTFEGGGVELVDGSNCETAGDRICDTPADPYVQGDDHKYLEGCIFVSEKKDANGEYYQPDVGNIMSYYGQDCGFTRGQYLMMANGILSASQLNW